MKVYLITSISAVNNVSQETVALKVIAIRLLDLPFILKHQISMILPIPLSVLIVVDKIKHLKLLIVDSHWAKVQISIEMDILKKMTWFHCFVALLIQTYLQTVLVIRSVKVAYQMMIFVIIITEVRIFVLTGAGDLFVLTN